MFQAVRLLDTHLALILLYAVANLPIVVWLMHDFFANLPIELEESAQPTARRGSAFSGKS